jgi:Protein of unknown function (DUF2852)
LPWFQNVTEDEMTHGGSAAWNDPNAASWKTGNGEHSQRGCAGRSRWSGWEIGAMVGGFVVFWPLGLVALGVKMVKGEMWPGAASGVKPWEIFNKSNGAEKASAHWNKAWSNFGARHNGASHSGNYAFEDYKKRELERLEAERRKLMEDQKAFYEFVERVRRAKDQEEFDRFMAERRSAPPAEEPKV